MKKKNDFEIFCYETDDGEICLELGEAAIRFSKKRFVEFADKLSHVSRSVMRELVSPNKAEKSGTGAYRI